MTTPRKYPTLEQFEALSELVISMKRDIEKITSAEKPRGSVWVDTDELAECLGLTDAYGTPVAVGDELRALDGSESHRLHTVTIKAATQTGKATVIAGLTGGGCVSAVDMRLPGHVVTRKATA